MHDVGLMTKQYGTTEACLGITPKMSTLFGCRKTRVAGMFRWAGTRSALQSYDHSMLLDAQLRFPRLPC